MRVDVFLFKIFCVIEVSSKLYAKKEIHICVRYMSEKFSVNELLKFTLTQIKILQFFGKIAKSNTRAIEALLVREIGYKRNSSFLMKTSDLTKILGKSREIN